MGFFFENMKFQKLYDRISKLNIDIKQVVKQVIDQPEVQNRIIELNQDQLQFKRVTGEGKEITRIYSSVSQSKFGKPNSEITLYDTGEFYGTMKVESDETGVKITGDTIKEGEKGTVDISGYIGGNPLGLSNESKTELIEEIKPTVVAKFREATS